jgi:hypothetical protein
MDLKAEKRPANIEAVKTMAKDDRMARYYNWIVRLRILDHLMDTADASMPHTRLQISFRMGWSLFCLFLSGKKKRGTGSS